MAVVTAHADMMTPATTPIHVRESRFKNVVPFQAPECTLFMRSL
jgi:hypothetical protein